MTSAKSKKKGARPGTRMRGAMEDAYATRGKRNARLYNGFSAKMHCDVVVSGALCFLHYLLAESDPAVVRVNYSPLVPGLDPKQQIGFHAEVVDKAGVLKLRTIRQASATPLPAQQEMIELCMHRYRVMPNLRIGKYRTVDHEVLTEQQLIIGNELLLRNWLRLLKVCARARYFPLAQAKRLLWARLDSQGSCTVGDMLRMSSDQAPAGLILAAAAKAAGNGECRSDLDTVILGKNTRFYLRRRE